MANTGKLTVEVEYGPALRTALDVLDLVDDFKDEIVDPMKRAEFVLRGKTLKDICTADLMKQKKGLG